MVSADDDGFVRLHDLETGGVSAAIGPRVAEHDLRCQPRRALAGPRPSGLGPGDRLGAVPVRETAREPDDGTRMES